MIFNRPLTREEQHRSQHNYKMFCFINGASYMCLGESVIILFAVRMGMSNLVISLIGTMLNIGYLLLPLGLWATARHGAARSQADFWICRNLAVLIVASSVFFVKHLLVAEIILLIGSFLFYGFRAAGCVMSRPLIGDIASEEERPHLLAITEGGFFFFGAVMIGLISLVLWHWGKSIYTLVGVIVFGSMLGITASTFVRKIDESSLIRESARQPILGEVSYMLKTPLIRKMIVGWFIGELYGLIIIPVSILTLKRGCGISDTTAILFSLIQFIIAAMAAGISAPLNRKLGPRKTLLIGLAFFFLPALFWLFLPESLIGTWILWGLLAIPFALQGAGSLIRNNALTCYFLMAVPKQNQVGATMVLSLLTSVGAGFAAVGINALLIISSEAITHSSEGYPMFRCFFALAIIVLGCLYPFVVRMETVIFSYCEKFGEESVNKLVSENNTLRHQINVRKS